MTTRKRRSDRSGPSAPHQQWRVSMPSGLLALVRDAAMPIPEIDYNTAGRSLRALVIGQ